MKKFSYEANGYNREEVNECLEELYEKTDDIVEKYKEQGKELRKLQKEINHYKDLQEDESKEIIKNAKQDASAIINDALIRAEGIETQRQILERNMEIFKKKLKLIMEQQNTIVEKIDELEIEDSRQ